MKLNFVEGALAETSHACLVVFTLANGDLLNGPQALAGASKAVSESGELGKGFGGHHYFSSVEGVAAKRVLCFNAGESLKADHDLRRAAAASWKALRGKGIKDILVSFRGLEGEGQQRAVAEGFFLADYQYTDLKTDKEKLQPRIESLTVHGAGDAAAKVKKWHAICQGTARARDLSQMPPNILNPPRFAELVTEWGDEAGYKTSVLDEKECGELGMGAFMSVTQGSNVPGKLMIMEYEPQKPAEKTIVFVGKAVTFDSGGLSLKPPSAMPEMKGDMGGGAAVAGIMTVLRQAECPYRVIGLIPSVENMPSGTATRPSDVVKSLSGSTVEINNTDAEGRLILADALTYAARYKPDYVVDFATLTGACLVALGPKVCGVMGNHQPLVDAILAAGKSVSEPFWQLPLVDEYRELLKSPVADICNVSSTRWGGTITAGLFLEHFAKEYQWAHCDIAAAIFEKGDELNPSGGTGIGVRMALEMIETLQS